MRVVLDTNVLVAASRSRNGASHALLSQLPDERFTPAVWVPLFLEYRAVLLRPENLLGRPAAQAEGFLDFLLSASHLQEIFFTWRPMLPDPSDDMLLELAVAAGAKTIVTHNLRDFRGAEKWGVAALPPSDFLKQLTQSS
jgi:putative PIN family toxin of toxin-antitoxin system